MSVTVWRPAETLSIVNGVSPAACPSSKTRAPAGSAGLPPHPAAGRGGPPGGGCHGRWAPAAYTDTAAVRGGAGGWANTGIGGGGTKAGTAIDRSLSRLLFFPRRVRGGSGGAAFGWG